MSDKVSFLERANVSDARPLARLTSDSHSATTAVFYLFLSLFFLTCCVRKTTKLNSTSIISRKGFFSAKVLAMSPLFAKEGISSAPLPSWEQRFLANN